MRTLFILLPILASLHGAASPLAPTAGEIETVESLMNFRVVRGNIWKDVQTDQPLYRLNHKMSLFKLLVMKILLLQQQTPLLMRELLWGIIW